MPRYVPLVALDELTEGGLKAVEVGGRRIVLALVEGEVYGVDGYCTHENFALDQGDLFGYELVCGLHFGSFDIRTGAVMAPPVEKPVGCCPIVVKDGQVYLAEEEEASAGS